MTYGKKDVKIKKSRINANREDENEMNTIKLKSKIFERGFTVCNLADEIGINKSTFYRKLNNLEEFTVGQVFLIGKKLNLSADELIEIFLLK